MLHFCTHCTCCVVEFAKLLNRSFTSVCNWEQGNRIPKTETIKEIAKILNVDYTYFIDQ